MRAGGSALLGGLVLTAVTGLAAATSAQQAPALQPPADSEAPVGAAPADASPGDALPIGAKGFFDPKRGAVLFLRVSASALVRSSPEPTTSVPGSVERGDAVPTRREKLRMQPRIEAPERMGDSLAQRERASSGLPVPVGEDLRPAPPREAGSVPDPASEVRPGIRYWIELETEDVSIPVTTGHAFESGDRIRLHLYSNLAGCLAVYYIGSTGEARRWSPPTSSTQDFVELPAYARISLPAPGNWLRFDRNPGVERLFVVFGEGREAFERLSLAAHPTRSLMAQLRRFASSARGSKDFLWETDEGTPAAIGTYAVSLTGAPLVIEIPLRHL